MGRQAWISFALMVFQGFHCGMAMADVQATWKNFSAKTPSCADLQARMRFLGLTMQEIQARQEQIQEILRAENPQDVREVYRRIGLPADLADEMVLEVKISLRPEFSVDPQRWNVDSCILQWQQKQDSLQRLPSIIKVQINSDLHQAKFDFNLSLAQICYAQNYLRITLYEASPQDGQALSLDVEMPAW